jgi:hypothetical protein
VTASLTASQEIVDRDVIAERWNQLRKWGVQHHPDGTGKAGAEKVRDDIRWLVDEKFKAGEGTWLDILTEEFYEAAAETDPALLRAELVQVAAVAVAWVEDLDSRAIARVREWLLTPVGVDG